ncbi:MAG: PLP-dependent aminotransferase family protein [Acidimicrobiales bacterium]
MFAARWTTATSDAVNQILAVAGVPGIISFAGGLPDPATFPTAALPALVALVLADGASDALQYAPTPGLVSTRRFVADRLERLEEARPDDGELMITSGAMEGIELIGLSLVDPGDPVVVEGPSYVGALLALQSVEARLVPVPLDDDGLDTERLAARLHSGARPKVVYTIPDFHNPAGVSLSAERRRHLLELADRYGFLIVEDVAYRELWFERPPDRSLWATRPDLVLQLGTFSKVFFPGVRLGWAAGPAPLIERMVGAKQTTDQCAGAFGQRLLEAYGRGGGLDEQLGRSRTFYRQRRDGLLALLAEESSDVASWTRPGGGFYTWLTVAGDVDTTALARSALDRHVAFVPGAVFYPDGRGGRSLRLSYSRITDDELETGVERLDQVIRSALGREDR